MVSENLSDWVFKEAEPSNETQDFKDIYQQIETSWGAEDVKSTFSDLNVFWLWRVNELSLSQKPLRFLL